MPRGGWGSVIKVAGLIALVALTGLFLFAWTVPYTRSIEQEATQRSEIYRQNAEDRIKRVCSSAFAKPDCVGETRQAQRENERQEQDLAAQKVTAWWTRVMGVAALIGMALSAVGVWLVKTTFDETRRANTLAKKSQRAIISVKLDAKDVNSGYLVCALRAENIGGTPALEVGVEIELSKDEIVPYGFSNTPTYKHIIKPGETAGISVMSAPVPFPQPFFVGGCARYRCIFGEDHESWFCFLVRPLDPINGLSRYINRSRIAAVDDVKDIVWPHDS
jgi:hypothetical protein